MSKVLHLCIGHQNLARDMSVLNTAGIHLLERTDIEVLGMPEIAPGGEPV